MSFTDIPSLDYFFMKVGEPRQKPPRVGVVGVVALLFFLLILSTCVSCGRAHAGTRESFALPSWYDRPVAFHKPEHSLFPRAFCALEIDADESEGHFMQPKRAARPTF